MRKYIFEFCRRGLVACGFGPMVLVVLYLILQREGILHTLTVHEVCLGIVSLSALAFLAGGLNMLYQIERLPLMLAILIHGGVLYIAYLVTYLVNGWLEWSVTPILVYSGIFLMGYLTIWAFIYCITKKRTERINKMLRMKRQHE